MKKYILYLVIGHILGDFYFQNERMVENKSKDYLWVLYHSIEYSLVMVGVAILVFNVHMMLVAICAGGAHFLIDTAKYLIVKQTKYRRQWNIFLLDQVFHVISFGVLAVCFNKWKFVMNTNFISSVLNNIGWDMVSSIKWLIAIMIVHHPANIIIQRFLADYKPVDSQNNKDIIKAEKNTGRMIGTLERIIMLILIFYQQYSALGLVLTAKSITRYNKIVEDKDFAEYYLLGTLMSFLIVLVVGCVLL